MHDFLYTVTTDARFFINCHDRFFCCGERLPPPAYLRPSHVSSRGNFRYKNAIRHMAVASTACNDGHWRAGGGKRSAQQKNLS